MGGAFNTVNLNLYHYAGNNPVVMSDPDGKYYGMEKDAEQIIKNFNTVLAPSLSRRRISLDDAFVSFKVSNNMTVTNIARHSKDAADKANFGGEQLNEYVKGEKERYESFAKICNKEFQYAGEAKSVLERAKKEAESKYDGYSVGKRDYNAYREADKAANTIIDNFIKKYDSNYKPPAYPEDSK
jgi:hypothetical protein